VAVLLDSGGPGSSETRVLLIERTSNPDDPWSGQMAFPGGRIDPDDESPRAAAEREAREEVGLDLGQVARFLGCFDDVRAMARGKRLDLVITPHVFELTGGLRGADLKLTLQEDEVADVLWAPVEEMASGSLNGITTIERPKLGTIKLPCYEVGGKVVWGLTHMMLRNLFDILERFDASRKEHETGA